MDVRQLELCTNRQFLDDELEIAGAADGDAIAARIGIGLLLAWCQKSVVDRVAYAGFLKSLSIHLVALCMFSLKLAATRTSAQASPSSFQALSTA